MLFRIWDPRVLPVFLRASEADHLQQLYARGPAYIVPAGEQLERLSWRSGPVGADDLEPARRRGAARLNVTSNCDEGAMKTGRRHNRRRPAQSGNRIRRR
ncbi:hypothetical protein HJG53_06750 [Sphingomonas sp. ID1715]|uniref:hypothetical protein n=1 Tax=Sphingomonas sp. ID1715 TaxID=1656898 RepID=UPI001489774F|nr:hypothetical protein [Sphingomonas sp. ID1715]NNM76596.1 hypothetical protein [Sphingomonas sp. ID1715]